MLADDRVFADFVVGALKALLPHAHLALLGRSFPDLPVSEWIAAGRARVFAVDDVRFDDDEVRALVGKLGGNVRERDLDALVSLYEGWPAGIALAFASGDATVPSRGGSLPSRSAYLLDSRNAKPHCHARERTSPNSSGAASCSKSFARASSFAFTRCCAKR